MGIIQILSAIAPLILALLTFLYLMETRKMRKEMEESCKEQVRPFIVLEVLPQHDTPQLLDIVIGTMVPALLLMSLLSLIQKSLIMLL